VVGALLRELLEMDVLDPLAEQADQVLRKLEQLPVSFSA
jgi:hypothetical protein